MKKIIPIIIVAIFFISSVIVFAFYYYFFLEPITKEESGIIKYSNLLTIENQTNTELYIVLNHQFSQDEINTAVAKNEFILVNEYYSKDTIILGGLNNYNNNEVFEFSGIKDKPEILPNNFSLTILDSLKHIIKQWNNQNFKNDIKLNYNERNIKISRKNGDFIIK